MSADRELLKRVAEAVRDDCHDQCGCHENVDLDAIIDRVVGEQGEVAEIRHALEGARREAEAQQPEEDKVKDYAVRVKIAAAHARGVAEERERWENRARELAANLTDAQVEGRFALLLLADEIRAAQEVGR